MYVRCAAIYGYNYIWMQLYMDATIYGCNYIWMWLYMDAAIYGVV